MAHPALKDFEAILTNNPKLDLTDQVENIESKAIGYGPNCEVFKGYLKNGNITVAVKKLRAIRWDEVRVVQVRALPNMSAYSALSDGEGILETRQRDIHMGKAHAQECFTSSRLFLGGRRTPKSRFGMDGEGKLDGVLARSTPGRGDDRNGVSFVTNF